MNTGAMTDYIDVAQIVLYVFWIFFAGLIVYLRREDKREGYPLESDRSGRVAVQGFPRHARAENLHARGRQHRARAPRGARHTPHSGEAASAITWAPRCSPQGNPMLDAVGPAAYAERATHPDYTSEGLPMIVPLRRRLGILHFGEGS